MRISSLICEASESNVFTLSDDKLTYERYDGEDVEPDAAPPAAQAPKPEPEALAPISESNGDAPAPQQQQAQPDDDDAKPFDPSAEDMDGVTNAPAMNYEAAEVDRTPVHMKDDG